MSENTEGNPAYQVGKVTVTPVGGGYYDLEALGSGRDVERVRGKENADARAQALSDELTPADSTMQAQQPLDQVQPLGQAQSDPAAVTHVTISIEELDKLRAAAAAAPVTTVAASEGPVPQPFDATALPDHYVGTMDPEVREKLGVETTRIILEENPDIPPTGLFVSHNGRGYMIKPGEPVDVPNFLIEILDHAVMSSPVVETDSGRVVGYRSRSKYPYRVVKD